LIDPEKGTKKSAHDAKHHLLCDDAGGVLIVVQDANPRSDRNQETNVHPDDDLPLGSSELLSQFVFSEHLLCKEVSFSKQILPVRTFAFRCRAIAGQSRPPLAKVGDLLKELLGCAKAEAQELYFQQSSIR